MNSYGKHTGANKSAEGYVKKMGLDREALHFACSLEFWRMAFFWTFSLLLSYFYLILGGFSSKSPSYFRCKPDPLTKPVCIITGATSGLGTAAAKALSREGFYVILAGRFSHLLCKTIEEIREEQKDAHLKAFQVDLSSFKSIFEFKNSVQQWLLDSDLHPSVQLLVNNAGILATSYRVTNEGYDEMMGTNYIGSFALTNLLLPLLKNSYAPSRIVNVTSFTHHCVSDLRVDEETLVRKDVKYFHQPKQYPFSHIYELTKFCLLLFSYELHHRLSLMDPSPRISVMAADPGAVESNLMREVPSSIRQLAFTVLKILGLLQSPENGVGSIIDAALAPPEASGKYFFGGKCRTMKSSVLSYDSKLAENLWTTSWKLFMDAQLTLGGSKMTSEIDDSVPSSQIQEQHC